MSKNDNSIISIDECISKMIIGVLIGLAISLIVGPVSGMIIIYITYDRLTGFCIGCYIVISCLFIGRITGGIIGCLIGTTK